MSELISGKEALIALANGESVQKRSDSWAGDHWLDISKKEPFNLECFLSGLNRNGETIEFRIKPRTIKINEIKVPAPFDPKFKDGFYYLDGAHAEGFSWRKMHDDTPPWFFENPVWRSEDEIKQVVAALRSIFK